MKRLLLIVLATAGVLCSMAQSRKHIVARGETMESIARIYDTSVKEILNLNPSAAEFIYVGMELAIPDRKTVQPTATPASEPAVQAPSEPSQSKPTTTDDYEKTPFTPPVYTPAPRTDTETAPDHATQTEDNENSPNALLQLIFQCGSFDNIDTSSCYGIGGLYNLKSLGKLRIEGAFNLSFNWGLAPEGGEGSLLNIGPGIGYEITPSVFISAPVMVSCSLTSIEEKIHTGWGVRINPAINIMLYKALGIFAGPSLTIGFSGKSSAHVGFNAGFSFAL